MKKEKDNEINGSTKILKKEKDNEINGSTKICDIEINGISKEFKEIFQEKKQEKEISSVNLNVSKITNIFDYYLKLIFKYVKKDIEKYQEKKEMKEKSKTLDELFNNNQNITKEDLASAIRLFITLVLYREKEKDKDKKIKSNKKNISDYLKSKDLWGNTKKFEDILSKIKELNIKIKEILYCYYYLVNNKDEGFEIPVEKYKEKLAEERRGNSPEEEEDEEEEDEEKDNSESFDSQKRSEEQESDDDNDSDEDSDRKKKKKKRKKKKKKREKKKKQDESDSD